MLRYFVSGRRPASLPVLLVAALAAMQLLPSFAEAHQERAGAIAAADHAFADEDWEAAASGYRAVLETDPGNVRAWLQLGLSLHALGDLESARAAYEQVFDRDAGGPFHGRALYHTARAAAAGDELEQALARLEELSRLGTNRAVVAAVESAEEFEALRDDPRLEAVLRRMTPCTSPEYRQFDFWVGAWVVYSGDQVAGHNVIEQVLEGCALHENWESASGGAGNSYSFYDAAIQQWHQTWIDANGGTLYLNGGWTGTAMVLTDGTNRVTWTPLQAGRVRQHWERTADGGATWATVFEGEYRPDPGGP